MKTNWSVGWSAACLYAAVVALAGSAIAQTTVGANDATAALTTLATFKPKDDFDPPPSRTTFAGSSFRFVTPIAKGTVEPGAYWNYDAEAHNLALRATVFPVGGFDQPGSGTAFIIGGTPRKPGVPHTGQNAYGVKVEIIPIEFNRYLIAQPSKGFNASRLVEQMHIGEAQLQLAPDEARTLTSHLQMVVEGTIKPFDGQHTMACEKVHKEPTVSSPEDITGTICTLYGHIDRMAYERTDTGAVVKEWRNPFD